MPVYVITGKLGSGKGLISVSKIQEYLNQGRRVATNIDLNLEKLINPWAKKTTVYRLPDFPTSSDFNSIGKGYDGDLIGDHRNGGLFLDEAALWFNSRTYNERDRAEKIAFITHARKSRWDIYFIVQDISVIDSAARNMFAEHVVYCRRSDRLNIPLVGPILSVFAGYRVSLPKVHYAIVKYGDQPSSLTVDRWVYRGEGIYSAYDTEQQFKPFDVLDPSSVALHTVLPPYYVYGRYVTSLMRFKDAVKNFAVKGRHFFLIGAVVAAAAVNAAVTAMPEQPKKGFFTCNQAYEDLYGSCDADPVLLPDHPYWANQKKASSRASGLSPSSSPSSDPVQQKSESVASDPLDGVYITGSVRSDRGYEYAFARDGQTYYPAADGYRVRWGGRCRAVLVGQTATRDVRCDPSDPLYWD